MECAHTQTQTHTLVHTQTIPLFVYLLTHLDRIEAHLAVKRTEPIWAMLLINLSGVFECVSSFGGRNYHRRHHHHHHRAW